MKNKTLSGFKTGYEAPHPNMWITPGIARLFISSTPLSILYQLCRNQHDDLAVAVLTVLAACQPTKQRNIADHRNLFWSRALLC